MVVSGGGCAGVARRAREVADVFALLKDPRLEETILLVDSASATAVVPLLAKVRGIVCTTGGMTSHLAIVSREFGLPCLMAADIPDLDALEGRLIAVDGDGTVGAAPA
jgi:phosphoenolpyruvate-protein kinase (PTS system EI component)